MKWLSAIVRELVGLFVDDGSLALALIAWVVAVALVLPYVMSDRQWGAPILLAGCLLILIENVRRTARR
jgi:hypothetical protein